MTESISTTTIARNGGIMTVEVGTITGEVELESSIDASFIASTRVRYAGAEEWYAVEGSTQLASPNDLAAYHRDQVASLGGGTADTSGDPEPGSVEGRDADDPAAGSFGGALNDG